MCTHLSKLPNASSRGVLLKRTALVGTGGLSFCRIDCDCRFEHLQVYGLKRLVRGLASGRQGARQGNALALSKLLADIPALSINEVLATMASELEVSGQAKVSFKLHHRKGHAFPEHVSVVLMRQAQLSGWQQWGKAKILTGFCQSCAGFWDCNACG